MDTLPMVRDGYFYALPLIAAAVLLGWLTSPLWAIIPLLLACFFLWFFRDPERSIPTDPGAVVSPGDGKVTDVSTIVVGNEQRMRFSIFLSVFNVHVNRTPIAGRVTAVQYQKGKFLVASHEAASQENEQNTLIIEGQGTRVVCRQIAGLIARRIVCYKRPGDTVAAGERIGYIKFGSRTDVIFGPEWSARVKVGDKVAGGSTVLAQRNSFEDIH